METVNENPVGTELDPLIEPPVSQMSMVQVLKEKIDRFVFLASSYEGSKKQLQRVLVALTVHPFNERPFTFSYKEEKELFDLGVDIVTEKLMFLNIGIEEQKTAKQIREKAETEKKEEVNGTKED